MVPVVLLDDASAAKPSAHPRDGVRLRMICCTAALLLHFWATPTMPPQTVVAPAAQAAPLPDAPMANSDCLLPVSQTVYLDSEPNSQTTSAIPTPELQPANPIRAIPADSAPPLRSWMILSVAQHGAAAFDAYSTRRAITRGAIEVDPLMRPFAHSPEIYAAIQLGPAVLDIVARRMQRSQNTLWRRTWWVPQSASTGLFLFSGIHNLQFTNKR